MSGAPIDLPAFPSERHGVACLGMTLRDYIAAKAMHAIVAKYPPVELDEEEALTAMRDYAISAYALADAMLKARQS